jgi:hypothetical protein
MPYLSDALLITKLLQATDEGRLAWEKSGVPDQFAAKYAGKWTLTIDKANENDEPDAEPHYWLCLNNAAQEEILKIYSYNEDHLDRLFELARRRALKVDEALNDLLKEIDDSQKGEVKDEDIPF